MSEDFFGALNYIERSECHLGPKKSKFSGPNPSNGPRNGFSRIKIIKSKRHIKKICTMVILCSWVSVFCILYSAFCFPYSVFCIPHDRLESKHFCTIFWKYIYVGRFLTQLLKFMLLGAKDTIRNELLNICTTYVQNSVFSHEGYII